MCMEITDRLINRQIRKAKSNVPTNEEKKMRYKNYEI